MRIYSAEIEETLRAGKLLAEWAGEGLLSPEQYQQLQPQTVSDLRTTNIFLRLVLFLFTVIVACAAIGLFFVVFFKRGSDQMVGTVLLLFALINYVAAEVAVRRFRYYRHGIEEALAACSVACLCLGISMLGSGPRMEAVVAAAGALFSLWIWHRFGLWYAFAAAMLFAVFLPDQSTPSHAARRTILVALYVVGLAMVMAVRPRHRFDCVEGDYSLAEAFLWLGVYAAINLRLPFLLEVGPRLLLGVRFLIPEFVRSFYWTTWVLSWVLPALVLMRGVRLKDRMVMAVGGITALLTFITNKPYLGWPRHTWDPMLLGVLLTGVALLIRRWLARGEGGIRGGFTATRMSERDKQWMSVSSAVLGMVTPQSVTPSAQSKDFRFGGGASGGGGAGGEY